MSRRWLPFSPRERRAVTLWGTILLTLGWFDAHQRGASTLSEAHRAFRRRAGDTTWTVVWGAFALWFWRHVLSGDGEEARDAREDGRHGRHGRHGTPTR